MMDTQSNNTIPDRSWPGSITTALPTATHQGGSVKCATGAASPQIKLPVENTIIGTWNVRTLYACGKTKELTHELASYRWDIIGLSEVRWTGFGETTTDEGHKVWYSGEDSKHQHGVGFIVHRDRTNTVLNCTPVSSRIITIRISARPKNISIIQVYAPTTDHEDEEVEEFYEELEDVMKKIPRKDLIVIQGDWNAKVGPDAFEHWAGTAGRFGIGETNDRGLRLLEFASSHKMTLANTLFPHKTSRRTTWHAPNGETHNQIDYILTPQRFKSSINKSKTRTFPGADIGSDHDLVLLTIKLKLKNSFKAKSPRIKFDIEKLKDPAVAAIFEATVGGKFAALNVLEDNIDTLTENIQEVLVETASEVLGKARKKNKPWVTDDILDLCDTRRNLKKNKHTNADAAQEYRAVNQDIRRKMKEAKEKWISDQCEEIEDDMKAGNSKTAYNTLKTLTRQQQARTTVIEDKQGNLLTDEAAVLKRWSEYCKELYNYDLKPDTSILNSSDNTNRELGDAPILQEEVEEAMRSLKEGKSPGIDNIPAELLKHGGPNLLKALITICQKIWKTKQWPKDWTRSLVIPLPKKGNLKLCQNYRTISLISHPSKIMLRVIFNRLKRKAEEILSEEQAGFRPKRSTSEQIFNIRLIIEKHLQHQKDIYHNFIDFKKAFDRVWQEGLWQVMRNYNFDSNLVQVIEVLYKESSSAVLLNNNLGDFFKTTVGVRQGCLLSPILFNIYLENIMQETLQDFQTSISIGGRPTCNLRFADDIDLMGGSEAELQNLTTRLEKSSAAYGMEVSSEKSKILVNSANAATPTNIILNGQKLEEVDHFKYLGSTLSKDGTSVKEIRTRLALATSAMTKLNCLWRSSCISFLTKIKLYRSLVLSVLLYGCESWTLTADTERRIQAFENKCYRRILHISYREHRTNEYVQQLVRSFAGPQEPLLAIVKRRKLSWFGHVCRQNTLSKTILQGTVEGGRRRGRQKKSWRENIKDWTGQTPTALTRVAEDRERWRRLTARVSIAAPLRRVSRDDLT